MMSSSAESWIIWLIIIVIIYGWPFILAVIAITIVFKIIKYTKKKNQINTNEGWIKINNPNNQYSNTNIPAYLPPTNSKKG